MLRSIMKFYWRMKYLILVLIIFIAETTYAEHTILLGLYSDHYGYKNYKDYSAEGANYKRMRPLNQGGPEASRLIGYMYSTSTYAVGACTFKNSFYEQTHCLIGVLRYRFNDTISLETGMNITYGYRPALIMQMASLSKGKKVLPIPIAGLTFKLGRSSISYNYMAPGISAFIYAWKI